MTGGAAVLDRDLFEDHDLGVDRPDPEVRAAVRRAVLGGIMHVFRTRKGWSVNDSASASGMAPMTWRRVEQGLMVRRRSLAQLDTLLGQPFGTVRRALDDDLAMVTLGGVVGNIYTGLSTEDPAAYLDELAERFRSGTVSAGVTAATRPPSRPVRHFPTSDIELAAELAVRLVQREDPAPVGYIAAAILEALPALAYAEDVEAAIRAVAILGRSGNPVLGEAAAELARSAFVVHG